MRGSVQVLPDGAALAAAAAEVFVTAANDAIGRSGRFTVALSGGSTPRRLYELLATPAHARRIDWSRSLLFWSDERCVPPSHAESNYRMAREALLAHVPVPEANVFRIRGEDDPAVAAAQYEQVLRAEVPDSFDLLLLGIGSDGHTASLFPGSPAVQEQRRWVLATEDPKGSWRITLTPPVINRSAAIVFLAAGGEKADVVARMLSGAGSPDKLPASIVHPERGTLHWLLDAAAAARLSSNGSAPGR